MPKRVLVTGGSGFIATNLIEKLLQGGHEIWAFTRDTVALKKKYPKITPLDTFSNLGIYALESINPQWVFHTAAYGIHPDQTSTGMYSPVNYSGTKYLLDNCCKSDTLEVFINIGSCLEYGPSKTMLSEETLCCPDNEYGVTKLAGTNYVSFVGKKLGKPIFTLRPFHIYGPHESPNRLIPKLINMGLKNQLPPLGSKSLTRDFVYVEDLIDTMLFISTSPEVLPPGDIMNVTSGYHASLENVVVSICDLLNISAEPQWDSGPKRPWDNSLLSYIGCNKKMEMVTGKAYLPTSLQQGLEKTIEWWKANQNLAV